MRMLVLTMVAVLAFGTAAQAAGNHQTRRFGGVHSGASRQGSGHHGGHHGGHAGGHRHARQN